MLLPEVEYARPATVAEAVEALSSHDGARALAGGQTLINVMKARAASPDVLVDLADLDELRSVSVRPDGALEIGAMVTYTELMTSPDVADHRPIVAEVAAQIADVQVRNRGTLGGNLCSSDPTNHYPPVMVALGATMTIVGPNGARDVPTEEFFLGVYMTAVGLGELLTKVVVPPGRADGFASVALGRDGTCIVNAAANVDGDAARVAIGCVSAVPILVTAAADEASVSDAVRGAELDPPSDVHASAEYRRHLAEVLAVRAVRQASERRSG
jgi:carbon-monoxide dehydrogenase medium subunit